MSRSDSPPTPDKSRPGSATDPGQLNLLLDALLHTASSSDRDTMIREFALQLSWVLDFEECWLQLVEQNGTTSHWQSPMRVEHEPSREVASSDQEIMAAVVRDGTIQRFQEQGTGQIVLCLPLSVGNRRIGAVLMRSARPTAFSRSDVRAVQAAAAFLALALDRLGRIEALARSNEELQRRGAQLAVTKEELEQSNAELWRSNKDLDDFAYIASHDLKEPLRGIANYADFLLEDSADQLDEVGQDRLATMKRLCQRMDDLVESLLHYSRVGRTELAIQETDLNAVVADIVDSLHVTLEQQEVEVRIPGRLPVATCDAVRVKELFRNLITNAIKYSDKPTKWIEIGCSGGERVDTSARDADDSGPTVFYVRDNGIGIPDKHVDSIFRIFKRLHGPKKYGGGTGAGLTFAKQIVERHGGRIWIESNYGEGSTFYFTLARERGSESSTATAQSIDENAGANH